jgi:hypothetical protein
LISLVGLVGRNTQQISKERVAECVAEVLSRPGFPTEPGPIEETLEEIWQWVQSLLNDIGFGLPSGGVWTAVEWLWGAIILLLVAFLAYWLRRRILEVQSGARGPVKGLSEQVVSRIGDLRRQAQDAEAQGDLTLALRLYFFALVIGLGQKGELEYNDAWTNRELLERGQTAADVAKNLKPLVGALNEHSFGERRTEPHEVRRFAELCESMLGGLTL